MAEKRNRFGLTERDMETIESIFDGYSDIKTIHLFGSRAKGNHRIGSDVDLAIMNKGVDTKTMAKIKGDFEESTLPYNIDLVDFTKLNEQEFIDHIQRVGILFFKQGHKLKVKK